MGPSMPARAALGLTHHLSTEPIEGIGRTFDGAAGGLRLLRPLREKGKVGREHTTAIEHVYAHGIPDHLKAVAKDMLDELLAEGCLAEKVGRSRRHVWLTATGQARLLRAEASARGRALSADTRVGKNDHNRVRTNAARSACSLRRAQGGAIAPRPHH